MFCSVNFCLSQEEEYETSSLYRLESSESFNNSQYSAMADHNPFKTSIQAPVEKRSQKTSLKSFGRQSQSQASSSFNSTSSRLNGLKFKKVPNEKLSIAFLKSKLQKMRPPVNLSLFPNEDFSDDGDSIIDKLEQTTTINSSKIENQNNAKIKVQYHGNINGYDISNRF